MDINLNIGIAPGAGDNIRCWDFQNYLSVADHLREKGFNVYFFLGPNEKNLLNECRKNGFSCPEWENDKLISNDIIFIMSLAKKMRCLLCNDGGTAWMFEFANIKTLKIFGVTDPIKFSRPGFSNSINIKNYGYDSIKKFPVEKYLEILNQNSFDFDILSFETSYQNRFYMNGNLVDVEFNESDFEKFLNEHKTELETVAKEFNKKIEQFKLIRTNEETE